MSQFSKQSSTPVTPTQNAYLTSQYPAGYSTNPYLSSYVTATGAYTPEAYAQATQTAGAVNPYTQTQTAGAVNPYTQTQTAASATANPYITNQATAAYASNPYAMYQYAQYSQSVQPSAVATTTTQVTTKNNQTSTTTTIQKPPQTVQPTPTPATQSSQAAYQAAYQAQTAYPGYNYMYPNQYASTAAAYYYPTGVTQPSPVTPPVPTPQRVPATNHYAPPVVAPPVVGLSNAPARSTGAQRNPPKQVFPGGPILGPISISMPSGANGQPQSALKRKRSEEDPNRVAKIPKTEETNKLMSLLPPPDMESKFPPETDYLLPLPDMPPIIPSRGNPPYSTKHLGGMKGPPQSLGQPSRGVPPMYRRDMPPPGPNFLPPRNFPGSGGAPGGFMGNYPPSMNNRNFPMQRMPPNGRGGSGPMGHPSDRSNIPGGTGGVMRYPILPNNGIASNSKNGSGQFNLSLKSQGSSNSLSSSERERKKRMPLCTFYLKGKCTKGDDCKFIHQAPTPKFPPPIRSVPLLEKLVDDSITQEATILVNCLMHFQKNNYFLPVKTAATLEEVLERINNPEKFKNEKEEKIAIKEGMNVENEEGNNNTNNDNNNNVEEGGKKDVNNETEENEEDINGYIDLDGEPIEQQDQMEETMNNETHININTNNINNINNNNNNNNVVLHQDGNTVTENHSIDQNNLNNDKVTVNIENQGIQQDSVV